MKRFLSALLSLTMLLALVPATTAAGFSDVKRNAWYADAVDYVVSNNIMSGYSSTKFGPNDTLTRAMMVQVLYNKEGKPSLRGSGHSFSDVPRSQWFNNAVTWASKCDVVSGFGNGTFKPDSPITIEQAAVILWNYNFSPAGTGSLSGVGRYSDWAANALRWCNGRGILDDVPFGNATETATRAQVAQMLTNYLTYRATRPVKYTSAGFTLTVPAKYDALVVVLNCEDGYAIYEKASLEAERTLGVKWGSGWLFDFSRVSPDEMWITWFPVEAEVFARDNKGYYYLQSFSGAYEQLRVDKYGNGYEGSPADHEQWNTLWDWGEQAIQTIIDENPALTPYTLDIDF